jgi:hypothetical protein
VARSNGDDRSPEEDTLARLKLAATTAEEAARWLRNSLIRLQTGHEAEFEIHSAEQALQVAIERMRGHAAAGTPERRAGNDGEVNDSQSYVGSAAHRRSSFLVTRA